MFCPCCRLRSVSRRSAPVTSLVPFPFLKPYCPSPIQLSLSALGLILFVKTLSKIFDACLSRLIVLWSSHVIALGFFFNGTITVYNKSSSHIPVLYLLAQLH